MYLTSSAVGGGVVHLAGHVTGSFRTGTKVTITGRTSCTTNKVVASARLGRRGTWSATAPAPTGLASTLALFRAPTTVLKGHATVRTYSLPDPVNGSGRARSSPHGHGAAVPVHPLTDGCTLEVGCMTR